MFIKQNARFSQIRRFWKVVDLVSNLTFFHKKAKNALNKNTNYISELNFFLKKSVAFHKETDC